MNGSPAFVTLQAARPALPCTFTLSNSAGERLATVRGDWTLDDDAVRAQAIARLGSTPAPRLVRGLQHARVRVECCS